MNNFTHIQKFNKNDKILILGSKGNLGGQLALVLGNDYRLILWDRSEIDITDKDLVMKKISDIKPNIIINAAAYNAVDKCEKNEEEYDLAKKINIDGPRNIAEATLMVGAIFIHYSTDYVFDGRKKEGYKEEDKTLPINRYGKTKAIGERQIITLSSQGLKWYLVRTSKLFGPKGENQSAKPNFFDIMLTKASKNNEIKAVDSELSCFTYTFDLAKATKKLIEEKYGYGIYHITNSKPETWYGATKKLFKTVGIKINLKPVESKEFPRPAKRPKYSVLLNTKFEHQRPWTKALKEYLDKNL